MRSVDLFPVRCIRILVKETSSRGVECGSSDDAQDWSDVISWLCTPTKRTGVSHRFLLAYMRNAAMLRVSWIRILVKESKSRGEECGSNGGAQDWSDVIGQLYTPTYLVRIQKNLDILLTFKSYNVMLHNHTNWLTDSHTYTNVSSLPGITFTMTHPLKLKFSIVQKKSEKIMFLNCNPS